MIHLDRILFPTDYSECSEIARDYACELAARFDAELHVVHVLEDVAMVIPSSAGYIPQTAIEENRAAGAQGPGESGP